MSIRSETHPPASRTNEADWDHILILTADHTSRSVPIHASGLTIGSKSDNDVVLDDPHVSEYHARIEREDGHYRIIDLNSATGTFLEETRLRPGVPAEWPPDHALRVGENWFGLRLAKDEAEAGEEETSPKPPLPEFDAKLIQWSLGKQIGVYVGTSQLTIAPGKGAGVAVVLFNREPSVDHFRLTVSGIPPNWVGALPSMVTIPANTERQVNLLFQLPQAPTTRAGRHVVTLQAVSQEMPEEQVEITLALTVLAYSRFVSTLHPETLAPDEPAQLKIENLGNTPETFTVTTDDPANELKFVLRDEWVRLPEGESSLVELRATPPPTLWDRRGGRTYSFSLHVRSASGQAQTHQAEVKSRAILPVWAGPVLLLAALCLCVGLPLAFANSTAYPVPETQTPTPTLVTTAGIVDTDNDGLSDADEVRLGTDPLLADTDGDGLRDGDEQRAGANPLVIDSDGDTLSDGREALELHTSPINSDTDGDGFNDNVDPDPGQLPTPTLLPPTAASTPLPPPPTFTVPPPTSTPLPPTATSAPPTASPPPVTVSGWIAFETRRDGNLEVYLLRADTRSELRLTDNAADDRRLAWAPTGNRMAFDSDRDGNSEIYSMNVDGTAQTRLTNNPARDFNPAWSPDGMRLAFLSDRDGNVEIYVMNADGAGQTRLTNDSSNECCPLWSPRGGWIAFMSDREAGWGIYRMNADGSEQSRLAAATAASPTWSPDGARLAFVSDRDGNSEIYLINGDGTGETRLTNNSAQDTNPVWSPNGSRIAFISNRDGSAEIYVMNPDGSAQTRLTSSSANECCLVWSPDGTQLAFVSDRDGNDEIYALNISSPGVLRLTNNPAHDAPLAWRP